MSPTTIALAADLLASAGEEVSVRAVCRVLKAATGKGARWSAVNAVIKAHAHGEFSPATAGQHFHAAPATSTVPATPSGNSAATAGQQFYEERATTAATNGNAHTPLVGPLFSPPDPPISPPYIPPVSSSSLRSSSSTQHVETLASKNGRPLKLPLDREQLVRCDEILRSVWQRLQPVIGRSTSFSDWRGRNRRIAFGLATRGFKPEHVFAAWEDASKLRGEPIIALSLVQKFLERKQLQLAGRSP